MIVHKLRCPLEPCNIIAVTYLLETRHNVASDGADQGCNVIHEAFWETVLPGWLQAVREVQVVDDALHLC